MTARIMDGSAVAAETLRRVHHQAFCFAATAGRNPTLAALLVSHDPANLSYMRVAAAHCRSVGIDFHHIEIPQEASTKKLVARIRQLSKDPSIDGILLHPLPAHMDARAVFNAIDPAKDVDGVTHSSSAASTPGAPGFVTATSRAILALLDAYNVRLSGRHCVVLGDIPVLGKTLAMQFLQQDATVTCCDAGASNLASVVSQGDIVVAASGGPGHIRGMWLKPGAVVIDASHNSDNICDVEYAAACTVASLITPVPNGLGPLTAAMLLEQTMRAARQQELAQIISFRRAVTGRREPVL